jgi:small-conductance mechanosensitive channel
MLYDILSGHIFETGAYGESVFLVLCCAAAWMSGRSIATEWKPLWNLALGVIGLGVATRFLHHALYQATFLNLSSFLLDTALLGLVAYIGYRFTRTNQMTRQYHWLYEKASPFSWRDKAST